MVKSIITEKEKKKLLEMSEVSLWINGYDDIFSDFDPRHYSQRSLSDDFLIEAKKFVKERSSGNLELVFLVPSAVRKSEIENTVKKRLHEHFKKYYHLLHQDASKTRKRGILLTFFGMFTLFTAYIVTLLTIKPIITNLFFVILEPSGWFMAWVGLESIFYNNKQKQPDLEFYRKMSQSEVKFRSY